MHISMIGPVYPYRGGIAHYTSALASALEAAGHSVQLISFKRQYPSALYPGKTDKDPSIDPGKAEARYVLDPLFPWTWFTAARGIAQHRPDMVLLHWWTTFWAPAYAAVAFQLRRSTRIAYLVHNILPHENRVWDRWLARLALTQGHCFIVQAPREEARLLDLIPGARVGRCSHPVYGPFSETPIPKLVARERLGLPQAMPVLLFFGIVRPYKGLQHLIEALGQSDPALHLVVAGEFWEDVATYREHIHLLGLKERVTLIDHYIPNEEAHVLFSAADALVAPYIGGTQSGAVQLALGYGLPAIVSDRIAAGMAESQRTLVRVIPAGNSPALAAALREFAAGIPGSGPRVPLPYDWSQMVHAVEEACASAPGRAA